MSYNYIPNIIINILILTLNFFFFLRPCVIIEGLPIRIHFFFPRHIFNIFYIRQHLHEAFERHWNSVTFNITITNSIS